MASLFVEHLVDDLERGVDLGSTRLVLVRDRKGSDDLASFRNDGVCDTGT